MPKEQYRVAIVGMGSIARAHVKAMSQTDRVNLVAACDVSQNSIDRFKSQFKIEHTYLDIDQMLAEEDIDIVIICTWGKFHESVGRQIAQSRCPRAILCEKPFTQTAEEAVRLVEAAEDNGVLIAEAFKFRHHPMHLQLPKDNNYMLSHPYIQHHLFGRKMQNLQLPQVKKDRIFS